MNIYETKTFTQTCSIISGHVCDCCELETSIKGDQSWYKGEYTHIEDGDPVIEEFHCCSMECLFNHVDLLSEKNYKNKFFEIRLTMTHENINSLSWFSS